MTTRAWDNIKLPPFETEDLRANLLRFLETPFLDPSGSAVKVGNYRWGVYAFFDYDGETSVETLMRASGYGWTGMVMGQGAERTSRHSGAMNRQGDGLGGDEISQPAIRRQARALKRAARITSPPACRGSRKQAAACPG